MNKLAKSISDLGILDFETLLHVFGYLHSFPDYTLKFYFDLSQAPVTPIC